MVWFTAETETGTLCNRIPDHREPPGRPIHPGGRGTMTPAPEPAENGPAAASTGRPASRTRAVLAERGFVGFVPFA